MPDFINLITFIWTFAFGPYWGFRAYEKHLSRGKPERLALWIGIAIGAPTTIATVAVSYAASRIIGYPYFWHALTRMGRRLVDFLT